MITVSFCKLKNIVFVDIGGDHITFCDQFMQKNRKLQTSLLFLETEFVVIVCTASSEAQIV